jgi:hypothetical protein
MNNCLTKLCIVMIGWGLLCPNSFAQTDGAAKLEGTILDYTGTTSPNHYTVVWVTTQAGAFIKSLRKQGPSSWTSGEWGNHCGTWNTARAGSTALDGYSTATAHNYTSETFTGAGLVTNSPIVLTWNGRDASNSLMPDGNYKFWVQYAENSGQGPVTTGGLLWTKGAAAATTNYPNQGVNFANMKVTWSPNIPPAPPTPPDFTGFQVIGNDLVLSGTGPTNGLYAVLVASEANAASAQWTSIATNSCDANGQFRFTNAFNTGISARFYRLRVQ